MVVFPLLVLEYTIIALNPSLGDSTTQSQMFVDLQRRNNHKLNSFIPHPPGNLGKEFSDQMNNNLLTKAHQELRQDFKHENVDLKSARETPIRRGKRWTRFDIIPDQQNNVHSKFPFQNNLPKGNTSRDEKRGTEIKIEAPLSKEHHGFEFGDDVWTNRLLPEIVKGVMKEYATGGLRKAESKPAEEEFSTDNDEIGPDETTSDNKTFTKEIFIPKKHHRKPKVLSATNCDEWDERNRACYFDRNIGDTITFVLAFKNLEPEAQIDVRWQQGFFVRNSSSPVTVNISPDDTMWNIVVGSNNREFRISPITETDFDLNCFMAVATIRYQDNKAVVSQINFRIRQMAIDMGFVYPGEHIIINVKSFMTLPMECCAFEWYLDRTKKDRTLPSNMKVSDTGITVEISELRMEQEGILACNVYSNKNVFLTKKRFLIKEFKKDILMQVITNRHNGRAVRDHYERILKRTIRQAEEDRDNTAEGFDISSDILSSSSVPEVIPTSTPLGASETTANEQNNNPEDAAFQSNQNEAQSNEPNMNLPLRGPMEETNKTAGSKFSKTEEIPVNPSDTQQEFVLETGGLITKDKIEVRMSKLLADCISNRQCSGDATCYQENPLSSRYCRCMLGFRGNGIFCWEEAVGRRHIPSIYFVKNNPQGRITQS